jgi:ribonuclease-3
MADGRPGEEASALPDERAAQLSALEQSLDVRFRDRSLLELALRHDSFAHERGGRAEHYERLEFLGDAVLNLVVSDHLYRQYPEHSEGELAKQRARLVNETALAHLGRRLHLGNYLLLGKGEEKGGGRDRPGLLADAVEAVLGAVYVDAGYGVAHALATRWLGDLLMTLPGRAADFKSQLQERLQETGRLPRYQIVETEGPDHARSFRVRVEVDDKVVGEGRGRSKKEAEQAAAEEALRSLDAPERRHVRRS